MAAQLRGDARDIANSPHVGVHSEHNVERMVALGQLKALVAIADALADLVELATAGKCGA